MINPTLYLIHDLITILYAELKILEFKPSIIAASAFLCAIQDLNALAFSSSKTVISSCEYVDNVSTVYNFHCFIELKSSIHFLRMILRVIIFYYCRKHCWNV